MKIGDELAGWRIVSLLSAGGQGETYVASDQAGRSACLKTLTDGHVRERRQRFAREAACYASLEIDGVPRLLASNVVGIEISGDNPLYLCIELIQGTSLDKFSVKSASKEAVLTAVTRLLKIVYDLHSIGIVHRDIKPQNIIARGSCLSDLWLVDFGLAFSSVLADDYSTETGQELGNRFLRLPELHAGSRTKQDPVSDVTFGVGILFYLVTGIPPRTLEDGQGRMPHQRDNVAGTRLLDDPEFAFLLPIFDKGFRTRMEERFTSALELTEALRSDVAIGSPEIPTLEQIVAELNEPGLRAMQQRRKHRDLFVETTYLIARKIEGQLNGSYVFSQTGHNITEEAAKTEVGFALGHDYNISERVPFEAKLIGAQIVATAWGSEILRADADTSDWGATLAPAIQDALVKALHKLRGNREARSN